MNSNISIGATTIACEMFSSNNSSRESSQNYPTQWALNPSAYQNVSNEQVDWAALAQQWIMMKESAPPSSKQSKEVLNEGGEAPMDVDNDKDDSGEPWSESNDNVRPPQDSWNWQQWGPWPGSWNEPPPPGSVLPPGNTAPPINKTALLPTPYSHFVPPATESSNTSVEFPSYDGSTSGPGGYWSNSGGPGRNKHPIKGNRMPRKGFAPQDIRPTVMATETVTLDAAKRRQLPAWIREGLEKMEREKQKQLDKERERVEREEYLSRKKEEKKGALELLQATDGSILPPKSKFDSDSGDSGEEEKSRGRTPQQKPRRRDPSPKSSSPPLPVTEEDKMLWVRRTMTEILLQVTSSEIDTICQEELKRYRSRISAKKGGRPVTSGASPSTVGSLGLGIYGGGSSDSESDSEANSRTLKKIENEKRSANNVDGEEVGSFSRRQHQPPHKDARRRNSTSHPSKREPPDNRAELDAQSDSSIVEEGSDSQVDTRPHGNSSQSSRSRGDNRDRDRGRERDREKPRHRTPSSEDSSSSDSEHTSSDKSHKKKNKTPPKTKPASRSHHRSSSSQSENNDSSSDSSAKRGARNRSDRRRRSRSEESDKRSVESNGRRKRSKRSASTNSGRESRRRTESRATVQNDRERDRDRPRREKTRSRTRSRSRTPSRRPLPRRRTRSRSRSRERRYDHRLNNRRRTRTRSRERERDRERDRRDSYRARRRSRSRSRSRTRSRSRSGGKRRGY